MNKIGHMANKWMRELYMCTKSMVSRVKWDASITLPHQKTLSPMWAWRKTTSRRNDNSDNNININKNSGRNISGPTNGSKSVSLINKQGRMIETINRRSNNRDNSINIDKNSGRNISWPTSGSKSASLINKQERMIETINRLPSGLYNEPTIPLKKELSTMLMSAIDLSDLLPLYVKSWGISLW